MTGAEIEAALEKMTIIVDTREQMTDSALRRFGTFGYPFLREKLNFGDYSAFVTLDDDTVISLANKVNIERKMNIDELAMCFGRERDRFEREFERMRASGGRMYLLVEGYTPEKVYKHRYKSKMHPNSIIGSLLAWQARYHIQFMTCDSMTSGLIIGQILKYEMREELMRYADGNA